MSIQYIVEGNIKTDFKGDIKMYSKGNISYNSGKEITQTGKEKGISYGKADKLYSNDRPISGIDVTLNLFFDGTQNNKVNSNLGEESGLSNRLDDSYTNDYSNVVRGYDAVDPNVENQVKVYIEGIGTVDGKRDSLKWAGVFPNNLGSPMGEGDRGIKAKITKGCIKAAYNLGLKFKNKDINKLIVNVFGFSRGAAAARHFIYLSQKKAKSQISDQKNIRVSPPREYELAESEKEEDLEFLIDKKHQSFIDQYGYFGACLVKNKLKIKRIVFNFAGLYDTVASFGGNHRGNAFVNNDSQQLHLHVIKKCKMVMHFVTQEEFRESFSLTNIDASGIKGIEFTLPGVHSDIGGGYRDQSRENVVIHKETLYYKGKPKECEEYKKILIEEGWYTEKDIEIREVVTEGVFYSIY